MKSDVRDGGVPIDWRGIADTLKRTQKRPGRAGTAAAPAQRPAASATLPLFEKLGTRLVSLLGRRWFCNRGALYRGKPRHRSRQYEEGNWRLPRWSRTYVANPSPPGAARADGCLASACTMTPRAHVANPPAAAA